MTLDIITNPWFYAVAVPSVMLMGISKSGFGGGFGALAVPMMALTFGDENKLKPTPVVTKHATTAASGLAGLRLANPANPSAVTAMPSEAMIRGSTRSDSRPAKGDSRVMTTGCAIITRPAVLGGVLLRYCRNKLIRTTLAKVVVYITSEAKQDMVNTRLV